MSKMVILKKLQIALTNYPELINYNWVDCKKFKYAWFKSLVNRELLDQINNGDVFETTEFSECEGDYLIEVFEEIIIKEKWYKRFFNMLVIHFGFDDKDTNACIIDGINSSGLFVLNQLNSNLLSFSNITGYNFQEFDYKIYQQKRFESGIKKAENSIKYYQDELNKLKEN